MRTPSKCIVMTMAEKSDSSDSDGPIIDDNIIRIQLRKPCQRKWELRTRNLSSRIRFPTIQLFDCDGNLLVETNDENISIKSSDFDESSLRTSQSLREKDFRHVIHRKPVRKHNTISGGRVYTRVYRTPLAATKNVSSNYVIKDSSSVTNIPNRLTVDSFKSSRKSSLETASLQSGGFSEVSSYKSTDNETSEDINRIVNGAKDNFEGSMDLLSSMNCSVSSLSEDNASSSNKENEPSLHKSQSLNDAAIRRYAESCESGTLPRSKSGIMYNPPNNKVSFLNTYLKSLPARASFNPEWFTLHGRQTAEASQNLRAKRRPKICSEKREIGDSTSDNELINIPSDFTVNCEMKKRLKMYRRGLSEITLRSRTASVFTKKRRHSVCGMIRRTHTSSSESVDEADLVLNRLKRRILRNKLREKRRSLGAKFQFSKYALMFNNLSPFP